MTGIEHEKELNMYKWCVAFVGLIEESQLKTIY